ncbi:hypothetical protein ASPZODRAFT_147170 [Penicilliopsis zonata CBS 506.65]|uniref:Nucleoside phosphorylase domain-containing protein n=1 Tax=Penicilliopsis zonata CBS 506.65 TaxID=1073090 RepID=A0A1L9S5X4_9EURO|nr:hypothetical protein ASPZODRAFT_147170 [Penicilliopsis zonata CBS 506.65]OJJ42530.1 hypothetical protein ASPZODRAFT_147170 [Penicilliopsis zonata CBS 506.65]
MSISPFANDEYTVGWVCAHGIDFTVAEAMLDETHGEPQTPLLLADHNTYVLGAVNGHKVVVACLPRDEIGGFSAAAVAKDMMHTFPRIRFGLVVGIGAGIPRYDGGGDIADIRLGDVVVGSSNTVDGGVVVYDFGKRLADGSFDTRYALDRPPRSLRTALNRLVSKNRLQGSQVSVLIDQMLDKYPVLLEAGFGRPEQATDRLFRSEYRHVAGYTCARCDPAGEVDRESWKRRTSKPVVHYGTIATGSSVVKHAPTRDDIQYKHQAICLETEAAGLVNCFPCLVIRGISNYADSHKNDTWRNYAAAAAAAYAKELLGVVHIRDVVRECSVKETLSEGALLLHSLSIKTKAQGY